MRATKERLFARDLSLLTLAHFLQALGYTSMLLLPLYLDHLGASRQRIGEIMALASAAGLLFRPAIGWALDTFGRKPSLMVGTVVLAAGMAVVWWIESIGVLVITSRVLVGIGTGILFTGYFTFASDLIPASRRTEGLALFGISGLAPLLVNPVSGLLGVDAPDVRWFLPVVGLLIAASFVPLALTREKPRTNTGPAAKRTDLFRLVVYRPLTSVWVATFALAALVSTYMAFATVAAAEVIETPANLWFPYAIGAILVRATGGAVLDRIGAKRLVPISLTIFGLAFLITSQADGTAMFLGAALFAGFGHGLGFPVITSQLVTRTPEHQRGSGVATLTALWEVSSITVTPAFGAIADAYGDRMLFVGGTALAAVALVLWWPLERYSAQSRLPSM